MTVVKICGLTNLADARWAWQCGADLLGFILVPASPRHVSPDLVAEIVGALRAEGCAASLVGVLTGTDAGVIRGIADRCDLDIVQLHGCAAPDVARCIDGRAIVAWRIADSVPWPALHRSAAWAHLLDACDPSRLGGTGRAWRWELLSAGRAAGKGLRLIVAGGLTPNNVGEAIRRTRPWGVDVSSGVESSPGRKDWGRLERFITNAREAAGEP